MKFMLDTNICVYLINGSHVKLRNRFDRLKPGDVVLSAITLLELQYGVANSQREAQNQKALNQFLGPLGVLDFPADVARLYGEMRVKLRRNGTPIGSMDLMIGVHCLHLGLTLVTNNESEFSRIDGLKIENWLR